MGDFTYGQPKSLYHSHVTNSSNLSTFVNANSFILYLFFIFGMVKLQTLYKWYYMPVIIIIIVIIKKNNQIHIFELTQIAQIAGKEHT